MQVSVRRWARQSALLGVLVVSAWGRAGADPGDRKRLGKAGDWKNTVAGAVMKNNLYSVESSGILYVTDLKTGQWKQIRKAGFARTKILLTAGENLYAIESDGSLYRVTPASGAQQRLGKAGDWKNTINGTTINGNLYTVEASGALYRTNPANAQWTQLGKPDFSGTVLMMGRDKAGLSETGLFTIEGDGTLYSVNPADGTWKNVGAAAQWKGSKAGAIVSEVDTLYVVNDKGALQSTTLSGGEGKPLPLGKPIYKLTKFLFVGHDGGMPSLYAIDSDGSLYAVEMAPMAG